jgi:rod shape-determining protein MreD
VLLVGIATPMIQGAFNTFVPPRFTPDLGFLVVIALGLHWRSAPGGLAIAAALGFSADLLSGSLLGEQALLRMFAFAAARAASRHLNLRGAIPQAVFVLALTAANALGIRLLEVFFTSGGRLDLVLLRDLPIHGAINALFAPLVSRCIDVLTIALGSDDGSRRSVRLPTQGGAA